MSQSPAELSPASSFVRYKQGWRALNRLLHEDKSFSGHEKNCGFLNLGNGQFASVSSVSGLDLDDDSRAIAICDWDFEGRLDFWMTARTAPRLRLMRNREKRSGGFVSLKLEGNGKDSNRDAVGARVEVILRNHEQDKRLIRTVHAGDAFLSQSSPWLHFGLGAETEIEKVIVQWPTRSEASRAQTVSGVQSNGFYLVRQGEQVAIPWQPPASRIQLEPSAPVFPEPENSKRIVLPARLPLPAIKTLSGSTEPVSWKQPLLINVWSATCPVCVAELEEWSGKAKEFQNHGLEVLLLNADAHDQQAKVQLLIDQLGTAFSSATATAETVQALDFFQRAMLDRWQPLPVPCSFLLDRSGQVVVIYKGAVPTEQLWDDLALLEASPEQLRTAAVPFTGQWLRSVPAAQPTLVSTQMVDHGAVTDAIAYLEKFLEANPESGQLAQLHFIRGILLKSQRRFPEALESLRLAVEENPADLPAHIELATMFEQARRPSEAQKEWVAAYKIDSANRQAQLGLITNLLLQKRFQPAAELAKRVLSKQPSDVMVQFRLATAYRNLRKWPEAIAAYRRTIELEPNMLLAANNLAWILATHPDDSLREGAESRRLAERICQLTEFEEPEFLDTLSVAYAENGDFQQAARIARKAAAILDRRGVASPERLQPLLDRINGFDDQKPYRETSDRSPPNP